MGDATRSVTVTVGVGVVVVVVVVEEKADEEDCDNCDASVVLPAT